MTSVRRAGSRKEKNPLLESPSGAALAVQSQPAAMPATTKLEVAIRQFLIEPKCFFMLSDNSSPVPRHSAIIPIGYTLKL